MLLLNLSGGSEKNTGFLVGAKNNEKQCLFDETSCSSFCLMVPSGRTRASPPSQKGHRPRRVFFSSGRKPPQRSGAREKVSGRPFFLSAHFHPIKKSARGGLDRKKNCFFGPRGEKNDGRFSRIYGIPFGEKRSRFEPEDQRLFGTERRSVKHAAVDVLSEKEGSPCGYPVVQGLKKLGKGGGGG